MYEKYVICIDKIPEDFRASLTSLLNKAIKAYESRGPQLRHGIALDKQVTVILSQRAPAKGKRCSRVRAVFSLTLTTSCQVPSCPLDESADVEIV